jgi:dTDP-4-amino-4,6-dideoxygalactose transaminase
MSAIGLNQLSQLDDFLTKRRHNADVLLKGLKKVDGVTPQKITPKTKPSYSYFSVVLDSEKLRCSRDEFTKALTAENIDCGVHYPTALTEQPIVKQLLKPKKCRVSEELAKWILSLPMHPYLSDTDLEKVIEGVEKIASHYSK